MQKLLIYQAAVLALIILRIIFSILTLYSKDAYFSTKHVLRNNNIIK